MVSNKFHHLKLRFWLVFLNVCILEIFIGI